MTTILCWCFLDKEQEFPGFVLSQEPCTPCNLMRGEALLGVLGIRDKWQTNFRDKG